MEDYEYYHVQEEEDIMPLKSAFTVEYLEEKIHAKNLSRDQLEELLAKALYVIHQRNFRETTK